MQHNAFPSFANIAPMNPDMLTALLNKPDPLLLRLAEVPGLYLVGGYLRDLWLGRETVDLDFALAEPFGEGLLQIEELLGARFFELSERFSSQRLSLDGRIIDISPLHADGIVADLARRDYGVNALALPLACLSQGAVPADLLAAEGALEDLAARRLASISQPNLADDPLRVLRGYRLAASLELSIDPQTRSDWQTLAARVLDCAPERIHEELIRLFSVPGDVVGPLRMMADDGLLHLLFPGIELARGCGQNTYHHLDVWEHTLEALTQLSRLLKALPAALLPWSEQINADWSRLVGQRASVLCLTRIALLLHDIAKPATRAVREDGQITFHNHQDVGAEMVLPRLRELRFSTDEAEFITLMIREHLRLGFYCRHEPLPRRLIYRYIRELGSAVPAMLLHSIADCMATQGRQNDGSLLHHIRAASEIIGHYFSADNVAQPPLLLDGSEIMQLLEIGPGRVVGEIKEALLEATAGGDVASEAEARCFVREMYEVRRKES